MSVGRRDRARFARRTGGRMRRASGFGEQGRVAEGLVVEVEGVEQVVGVPRRERRQPARLPRLRPPGLPRPAPAPRTRTHVSSVHLYAGRTGRDPAAQLTSARYPLAVTAALPTVTAEPELATA